MLVFCPMVQIHSPLRPCPHQSPEKNPQKRVFSSQCLEGDYFLSASAAGDAAAGAALSAGALIAGGDCSGPGAALTAWPPGNKGTMSKATMLMILISGLTAGPAVSL
jgi:hypothetical protein